MRNKDEVAQERFGANYGDLSAWAQEEIDLVVSIPQKTDYTKPILEPGLLEQRVAELQERVSRLEEENNDIWNENTDLKGELESLRAEINRGSS